MISNGSHLNDEQLEQLVPQAFQRRYLRVFC